MTTSSESIDARLAPGGEPDEYRPVRLDCIGTDIDLVFPPDVLENPHKYGAVHQETIDQVRAAQAGGLVQVWCVAPRRQAARINPGNWVSLSPQSIPSQPDGMEVITARVDACLLRSKGSLEYWGYEGPTVPAVAADSDLEPPHTGAWVLLEADELAEVNHLAVWYPTLKRAEWALNQSAYIDAVATDASENWVEVSAVESLSVRADTVTEGHFEFETEADGYGPGYDPIDPDHRHAWSRSITDQDRALLKSLADQLNPVAQGLVSAGFEVSGPDLFFTPPRYRDGYAALSAHNLDGEAHYLVKARSALPDVAGGGGAQQCDQRTTIEVQGAGPEVIEEFTDPPGEILAWIVRHDKEHPKPSLEPPIYQFDSTAPTPPGPFFPCL